MSIKNMQTTLNCRLAFACLLFFPTVSLFGATVSIPPSNFYDFYAGSSTNPYLISSLANLRWLSETREMWSGGFYFLQTADIDASETIGWNHGVGFFPIGIRRFYRDTNESMDTAFFGNFNGNNYVISNLFIDKVFDTNVWASAGLFGFIRNSSISNVKLRDVNIKGNSLVGALVAQAFDSTVSNCFASGELEGNGLDVGGLIGMASGVTIKKSSSSVFVTNNADGWTGGLVGQLSDSSISNSFFYGMISATADMLSMSGGLVGGVAESDIQFSYVAGLSNFVNAYGFVGHMIRSTIINAFWDVESTGVATAMPGSASNISGLSTIQLQSRETFTNDEWDFETIWDINPDVNGGFPYLRGSLLTVSDFDAVNSVNPVANLSVFVFPNPVRNSDISFKVNVDIPSIEIGIYNVRGQLVKRSRGFSAKNGMSTFVWNRQTENGQKAPSGIYLYRVTIGNDIQTGRFLVMK